MYPSDILLFLVRRNFVYDVTIKKKLRPYDIKIVLNSYSINTVITEGYSYSI